MAENSEMATAVLPRQKSFLFGALDVGARFCDLVP